MKEIRIEKITLNMGMGEAGEKLKKALKLLKTILTITKNETHTRKQHNESYTYAYGCGFLVTP